MAGVPISNILAYPKELTDKHWQKKKGLIAKTKKTGVGAELRIAEALHKKIDATKIDPNSANPNDAAALEKAVKDSVSYYKSNVGPLQVQLKKIVTTAKSAEATLKKTKGAGSGAKAAAVVNKCADQFAITCKSLDLVSAVDEAKARIKKRNDLARKFLGGAIKKFAIGAKAFLQDPSEASWGTNIKQQGRSVSNSVKQLEAYNKAFWSEFSKFQGFDLGTLKLGGDEPKTRIKQVALVKAAAVQVGKIAKFKE